MHEPILDADGTEVLIKEDDKRRGVTVRKLSDGSEIILMKEELSHCAELYFKPKGVRCTITRLFAFCSGVSYFGLCYPKSCCLAMSARIHAMIQTENGVAEVVKESVERCAIENRKELYNNIFVIGMLSCSGLVSEAMLALL